MERAGRTPQSEALRSVGLSALSRFFVPLLRFPSAKARVHRRKTARQGENKKSCRKPAALFMQHAREAYSSVPSSK